MCCHILVHLILTGSIHASQNEALIYMKMIYWAMVLIENVISRHGRIAIASRRDWIAIVIAADHCHNHGWSLSWSRAITVVIEARGARQEDGAGDDVEFKDWAIMYTGRDYVQRGMTHEEHHERDDAWIEWQTTNGKEIGRWITSHIF